jgi:hypothetical protein
MSNSNSFKEEQIIDFIKNNSKNKFTKNSFLFNHEVLGIDNIYIGNIYTMYKLITHFFNNLDDILNDKILNENKNLMNPERLVYRINSTLFD